MYCVIEKDFQFHPRKHLSTLVIFGFFILSQKNSLRIIWLKKYHYKVCSLGYNFESFPFFFWWVWLMVYQFFYLLKEPAFSFIDLSYWFLHFFFIYFWSEFYDFFPSANLGVFVLLSLFALGVRLGCLFEMFLVSKGKIVLL